MGHLTARLDGALVNAGQQRVEARQNAENLRIAEAQRAAADEQRRQLQQALVQRQIITAFRDNVCERDVVDRMPVDVRARLNEGTSGNEATGRSRQPKLNRWLLGSIEAGNGTAHPLYDYLDAQFKVSF